MTISFRIINLLTRVDLKRRLIHNNSSAAFSKLGSTFNQRPTYQSKSNNSSLKNNFNDFAKIFSSIKVPSYLSNVNETPQRKGLFGLDELVTHDGFHDLKQKAELNIKQLIEETNDYDSTLNATSKRNIVQIFDDISNELCRVADLAEFVRTSHPDVKFRETANLTFCSISQIVEKLNTNSALYKKLKNEYELSGQTANMDDCDKRVCKLFLIDFEQSGIHLDEKTRNKVI
jgi:hypothetical protein